MMAFERHLRGNANKVVGDGYFKRIWSIKFSHQAHLNHFYGVGGEDEEASSLLDGRGGGSGGAPRFSPQPDSDRAADVEIHASVLRACARQKALPEGRRMYAHLVGTGRDTNTFLSNLVMLVYSRCGDPDSAQEVFGRIRLLRGPQSPPPGVFSWNIAIAACARNGRRADALGLFRAMCAERVPPDKVTFLPLLSAPGKSRSGSLLAEAKWLHCSVVSAGVESDVAVKNALVNMYGECGSPSHARFVFDSIKPPNVIASTAMISAYAHYGHGLSALELFQCLLSEEQFDPDMPTFLAALDACVSISSLRNTKTIHGCIVAHRFESVMAVQNLLVSAYGKCSSLNSACAVFKKMPRHDIISWNSLIDAHSQCGNSKGALCLFERMRIDGGIKPNLVTFHHALDACSSLTSLLHGREIHRQMLICAFKPDPSLKIALMHMYGKCGSPTDAQVIFDEILTPDVIAWNVLIAGYVRNGQCKEALECFWRMGSEEGIRPDRITYICALDACAGLALLGNGRAVHEHILRSGIESDMALETSILTMYASCGSLADAHAVFDGMKNPDVISWTAMIAAYARDSCGKEALELFSRMVSRGVKPDKLCLLSCLDACACVASPEYGRRIHERIVADGLNSDQGVGDALVSMYGKCGSLDDAHIVFSGMRHRQDTALWNVIIAACARNGSGKEAFEYFRQMELEGVSPDRITLLNILTACSHAAQLDEGCHHFVSMRAAIAGLCMTPTIDHYLCMVDLLGRVGCLKEAEDLIKNMPVKSCAETWATYLGACQINGYNVTE